VATDKRFSPVCFACIRDTLHIHTYINNKGIPGWIPLCVNTLPTPFVCFRERVVTSSTARRRRCVRCWAALSTAAMGKKKQKRPRHKQDGLEYEDGDNGPGMSLAGGRSTHGPPVATTSGRLSGSVPNDEWQTTRDAWQAISPFLSIWRDKCVWMPFYYDGACGNHLRSIGFTNVVHTDDDFFERVKDRAFMATVDLIWDNPPYTTPAMKERVLKALADCGKPFVMLLPISVLHVAFVRDIIPMDHVQAIIPRRVMVQKVDGQPLPFKYLCWFCCHAGLERDLIFVDDIDNDD
jgi:hypothetical protein